MKKLAIYLLTIMVALSSCKKDDPLPDVKIKKFSIKEFPQTEFTFDDSSEPILITNTAMLPYGTDLSSLTPEFELSGEGSLLSQAVELTSGVSNIDLTEGLFLKTVDGDGEIDHYYQLLVEIEEEAGPVINTMEFVLDPYKQAPLAGLFEIEIDRACVLEIKIVGQDNNDLTKEFDVPATSFSVPLLGLYAQSTNQVIVTVTDQNGLKNQESLYITTEPLTEYYPGADVIVSKPEAMEDGMILVYLKRYNDGLNNGFRPLACMIDKYGKVRWIYSGNFNAPFKRLNNGNWLVTKSGGAFEMDMLGHKTGNEWDIPHVHHDIVELPNGNFLALSEHEDSVEDVVLEIGRTSGFVEREWDLKDILDPDRPKGPYHPNPNDWLHLNGLDYDPIDDAMILSGRNQSALVKVGLETSEIFWILGNHELWPERFHQYLLTPVGKDFEWSWGQHAPMLHPNDNSRVILFDNGNERSYDNPIPASESYSRGVEYQIDEARMEVTQLWQYGKERGRELFCPYISDANYLLKTDNRLICFGGITRTLNGDASAIFDFETGKLLPVKNFTHVIETDISGNVVFEVVFADKTLSYVGFRSYRADKVSLYPEPVE